MRQKRVTCVIVSHDISSDSVIITIVKSIDQ